MPVDINEKPSRTARTPIKVPCKPCARQINEKPKNEDGKNLVPINH